MSQVLAPNLFSKLQMNHAVCGFDRHTVQLNGVPLSHGTLQLQADLLAGSPAYTSQVKSGRVWC